jgi:hypothetical protein
MKKENLLVGHSNEAEDDTLDADMPGGVVPASEDHRAYEAAGASGPGFGFGTERWAVESGLDSGMAAHSMEAAAWQQV